jgi:hypothetical protein
MLHGGETDLEDFFSARSVTILHGLHRECMVQNLFLPHFISRQLLVDSFLLGYPRCHHLSHRGRSCIVGVAMGSHPTQSSSLHEYREAPDKTSTEHGFCGRIEHQGGWRGQSHDQCLFPLLLQAKSIPVFPAILFPESASLEAAEWERRGFLN